MKTLLLKIFLLSPILTLAQVQFTNLSSLKSSSDELYFGVENFLRIDGINYSATEMRFSVTHGEVSKVDANTYSIFVGSENPDTLRFFEAGKLILSKVFMVKTIPPEIARLGNVPDTTLSVVQILANPFLTVILPECNYKHEFRILEFMSSFIDSKGDTTAILHQFGEQLSSDQLKNVKGLKPKDKIYFSSIRVTCPSCRIRALPPLTIVIK